MRTRVKFWLFSGVLLANLGLFLQPQAPGAFLLQALTAPWATFTQHGLLAVLLFWGGAALLLAGAVDRLRSRPATAAAGSEFDDGWAFL